MLVAGIKVMASVIKHILYFDIETKYLADEVGGWDKSAEMGISVATSYDSGTGQYYSNELGITLFYQL